MFRWDLSQGQDTVQERLRDSSDISPQLSCLAASQAGLVVARTDQQQLVCLVLPDVWPVMSVVGCMSHAAGVPDVCRIGTECVSCGAKCVS